MLSPEERDKRILEFYPLVRMIAARLARRLSGMVELDELTSIGVLGLIEALDRYDPTRGVPFKAFAEIRIRGAMVDSLREADHVPRSVRERLADLEAAQSALRARLGREPTGEETAAHLRLTPSAYNALRVRLDIRRPVSLEWLLTESSAGTLGDHGTSPDPTPEEAWLDEETSEEVKAAITRLPRKERAVIRAYYFEEAPLKKIGGELGVTESRISQLRGRALERLQGWLTPDGSPTARAMNAPPPMEETEITSPPGGRPPADPTHPSSGSS